MHTQNHKHIALPILHQHRKTPQLTISNQSTYPTTPPPPPPLPKLQPTTFQTSTILPLNGKSEEGRLCKTKLRQFTTTQETELWGRGDIAHQGKNASNIWSLWRSGPIYIPHGNLTTSFNNFKPLPRKQQLLPPIQQYPKGAFAHILECAPCILSQYPYPKPSIPPYLPDFPSSLPPSPQPQEYLNSPKPKAKKYGIDV